MENSLQTWHAVDGDSTYALDWPLDDHSAVLEVGAYKGRWARQIYEQYHCDVYAFEPQPWAFKELVIMSDEVNDIRSNGIIIPRNYALGSNYEDTVLPMGEFETDACSFLLTGQRKQGHGRMRNVNKVFEELGLKHIDLMMVNIEGYEYKLLGYMLGTNLGSQYIIDRICVQWHTFADPNGVLYKQLLRNLIDFGYTRKWSFYPTLECFELVNI